MTATVTASSDGRVTQVSTPAGETSGAIYLGPNVRQCVVTCIPGTGGTMYAEATFSTADAVAASTATWFTWDAGTVSSKSNQMLYNATAVRFTAATATGVGEVAR